jgi:A/G-specific adenine glycosylase
VSGAARRRPSARHERPANAAAELEPERLREFSRRLRAWFRRHGRDLPWRRTRDPYRVLVSELMLQQTQVSRVVDYYERFLTRFPTLAHVAEAPRHQVVASWAGLGYYARARNLHALARLVTRDGAAIPADPSALRALPGIGAYTAGAVASFAYERRAPLVDTNVARVLNRAFAPALDARSSSGRRTAWAIAERLLPRTGRAAWIHNQALMELGALVCTARVRHCDRCPVASLCATRIAERPNDAVSAPRRRPARRRGSRDEAVGA